MRATFSYREAFIIDDFIYFTVSANNFDLLLLSSEWINLMIFTFFCCFFFRLSGSTAIGTSGNGNGGNGNNAGGGGGGGSAGNGTSGGDFLRRSHPLSEHTALHPAYRINYMDHLYHQLQASTHSPNASLHGNYSDTRIEVFVDHMTYLRYIFLPSFSLSL